jgi:hypothetical protein
MPVRALTLSVVVMGAMIVAGFALLAAKIAGRVAHPAARPVVAQPIAAAPIELPKGAHIAAIGTGADRVVVDVALADGGQELLIIDLATGRRLVTVPLRTKP